MTLISVPVHPPSEARQAETDGWPFSSYRSKLVRELADVSLLFGVLNRHADHTIIFAQFHEDILVKVMLLRAS